MHDLSGKRTHWRWSQNKRRGGVKWNGMIMEWGRNANEMQIIAKLETRSDWSRAWKTVKRVGSKKNCTKRYGECCYFWKKKDPNPLANPKQEVHSKQTSWRIFFWSHKSRRLLLLRRCSGQSSQSGSERVQR